LVSSSVWQSGISSGVRLAAMMPAMRAAASTSPLGASPRRGSQPASPAPSALRPAATAVRVVTCFGADIDHGGVPLFVEMRQIVS
jgi:hypothetical protein